MLRQRVNKAITIYLGGWVIAFFLLLNSAMAAPLGLTKHDVQREDSVVPVAFYHGGTYSAFIDYQGCYYTPVGNGLFLDTNCWGTYWYPFGIYYFGNGYVLGWLYNLTYGFGWDGGFVGYITN